MRAVTLQDVADRSGVSRATASLALSGKGRMSDETRQRVRDAATELEYSANIMARHLRTARSGAVGLSIPDPTFSVRYHMEVAFAAVERAQRSDLLVTLLPRTSQLSSGIIDQLDGFILIDSVEGDPLVERLLAGRKPVVAGEHVPEGQPEPWATVYGDHAAGMRLLLDHVWERGSRRPAVMLPHPGMAWGREMAAAYALWCEERGVEQRRMLSRATAPAEVARREMDEVFARPDRPDAVVVAPEGVAITVVDAIRRAGLEPGRDVLVASSLDSDAQAVSQPGITALNLFPREMGQLCMDELVAALDGGERGRSVELPIELILRGSTAGIVRR